LKYLTPKHFETFYLLPLKKQKTIPIPTKIPVFPSQVIERVNETIKSFKPRIAITRPIQIIQNIGGSLEEYLMQGN
jgi:hypothetical protein